MYDDIMHCRADIAEAEARLEEERITICKILGQNNLNFTTVGNHQYLIEVKNSQVPNVPLTWMKISGTKRVSRFRSSEVENKFKTLCMLKEKHKLACHEAWNSLLREFNQDFFSYKEAIQLLASMDCYFSLAEFSRQDGYCRPKIFPKNEKRIKMTEGRHPVLEKIFSRNGQYVTNSTDLSASKSCMILTGPNMGGKSSYLRQVALVTLLAHLGAHVPARSAEISVVDAIYTRMGAKDEILENRSTFMVEMQEAAEILRKATEHSLVILDELGRGTSTHDGTAIAYATLQYLVSKIQCLTLFVTHYLPVTEMSREFPETVINYHMTFVLGNENEELSCEAVSSCLTFLYKLQEGVSNSSYGSNVGRLAGLPSPVLKAANHKSKLMYSAAFKTRLKYDWFQKIFAAENSIVIKEFLGNEL